MNKKIPFDYFEEYRPKQEVHAFSKHCDSIMNRVSVKSGNNLYHSKNGIEMKTRNSISNSLADLPKTVSSFKQLQNFQSQKQIKVLGKDQNSIKNCFEQLNSKEYFESERTIANKTTEGKKNRHFSDCYLKYSSKSINKNISIRNSFYIEQL